MTEIYYLCRQIKPIMIFSTNLYRQKKFVPLPITQLRVNLESPN